MKVEDQHFAGGEFISTSKGGVRRGECHQAGEVQQGKMRRQETRLCVSISFAFFQLYRRSTYDNFNSEVAINVQQLVARVQEHLRLPSSSRLSLRRPCVQDFKEF